MITPGDQTLARNGSLAASVITLTLTGILSLIAGAARVGRLRPARAAASTGEVAES
ncbi:hypothetical protein [Micromonospora sp. NPDC023814]|uniref:hypothetical protein n=1 Tax=Micromonospora sp. NPDC023814 TaxID=3154596 RepID=UPI0033DB40C2